MPAPTRRTRGLAARLLDRPGVNAVVPFAERQALVAGAVLAAPGAASVRAVPADLAARDPAQAARLAMLEGSLDLSSDDAVVIGAELSAWLGAGAGDPVDPSWLGWTADGRPTARTATLRVTGVFRCGYYEYDAGLVLVALGGPASARGPLPSAGA